MRTGVLSGCRLLNPAEDWAGNAADLLNTRGLKKVAELTCAHRGGHADFLCVFFGGAEGCKAREEDFCSGETTERKLLVGKGQLPPTSLPG